MLIRRRSVLDDDLARTPGTAQQFFEGCIIRGCQMDSPPARNVAFDDCGRALALQLIKGRKVQRSRAVCNDPGRCSIDRDYFDRR